MAPSLYYVIGPDDKRYGPATLSRLSEWVAEGCVAPETKLEDGATGCQFIASSLSDLKFPSSPPPVVGAIAEPTPPSAPPNDRLDLLSVRIAELVDSPKQVVPVPLDDDPDVTAANSTAASYPGSTLRHSISSLWRSRHTYSKEWLAVISLVLVFVMSAFGMFWVFQSGYKGYENTVVRTDVMEANADAVRFLNQGNFEAALPRLKYVLANTPPGSLVYANVQHNMGTYWMEAAQAAQQRGELQHAQEDYTHALPLLPERRGEISQAMQSLRLGLTGPGGPGNVNPGTTSLVPETRRAFAGGLNVDTLPARSDRISSVDSVAEPVRSPMNAPSVSGGGSLSELLGTSPSSETLARSRDEYQAGLSALARTKRSEAVEHFGNAVSMDPGAPWASDAQRRYDELERGLSPDAGSDEVDLHTKALSEYKAGLDADTKQDAMDHLGIALELDPGAPWAPDALRRWDRLKKQIKLSQSGG